MADNNTKGLLAISAGVLLIGIGMASIFSEMAERNEEMPSAYRQPLPTPANTTIITKVAPQSQKPSREITVKEAPAEKPQPKKKELRREEKSPESLPEPAPPPPVFDSNLNRPRRVRIM